MARRHSDVLGVEARPAADGKNPGVGAYARCRWARLPDNAASLEAWHYRRLPRGVVAAATGGDVGSVYTRGPKLDQDFVLPCLGRGDLRRFQYLWTTKFLDPNGFHVLFLSAAPFWRSVPRC